MHGWRDRRQTPLWWAAVLTASLVLLAACGAPASVRPGGQGGWETFLPWGPGGVAVGRTAMGVEYGPLAAALSDRCLVVADSFRARLLVWSRDGGLWSGPTAVALTGGAPVVALSVGGVGGCTVAGADAAGSLWLATVAPPAARRLGTLAQAGALTVVTGVAVQGAGSVWADVSRVDGTRTERILYAAEPGSGMRPVQQAAFESAAAESSGAGNASLTLPAGVRTALAPSPRRRPWVVGSSASGRPALLPGGGVLGRRGRPLPLLRAPADFLGVGPHGRAYFTEAADGGAVRLVALDAAGRATVVASLAAGDGPRLGQQAALASDGALLVLESTRSGLRLRWFPPGGLAVRRTQVK